MEIVSVRVYDYNKTVTVWQNV